MIKLVYNDIDLKSTMFKNNRNSQLLSKEVYPMYQRERLNNIIEILRQNNYVTVKYLVKHFHTEQPLSTVTLYCLKPKEL